MANSTLPHHLLAAEPATAPAKRPRSFWDTVLTSEPPPPLPTPSLALPQVAGSFQNPSSTLITSPISDFGYAGSPFSPDSTPYPRLPSPPVNCSATIALNVSPLTSPPPKKSRIPPTRTIAKPKSNSFHPTQPKHVNHQPPQVVKNEFRINSTPREPATGQQFQDKFGVESLRSDSSEAKPHMCDTCGSSFARSSHLRLHIRTIHYKLKPFQCGECGASFGHVSSKYRHFRTVHLKRRDFACDRCGQTFAERSAVLKHCRTVHEGSRPYPCPTCGFRFHFKLHLAQHVATVHDKLRPHQCPVCNARFGQRSSLNRHARQIHGDCATSQASRPKREVVSRIPPKQNLEQSNDRLNFFQKPVPDSLLSTTV